MTTAATTAVRRRYLTAVFAAVAIIATSCHAARPPKTESRLFDVPVRVAANASRVGAEPISITFEGGRTATAPPDESLYTPVDVAPVNKTAAAAGDYDDDYEFSSTDDPGLPGYDRGRYPSADGNGTTTTTTVIAEMTTMTILPPAMNATVTSAATDTTVTPRATKITVTPPVTDTTAAATATVAPATVATTTESGILMQVASPPGYSTTTPTTATTPITTTAPTTTTASTTKTTTHLPPNSATAHQQHSTASVCLLVLVAAVITSMS